MSTSDSAVASKNATLSLTHADLVAIATIVNSSSKNLEFMLKNDDQLLDAVNNAQKLAGFATITADHFGKIPLGS